MKIVFGTGSFKLLRKLPSELGLPIELNQSMIIEKRQKYFHLFWIPFFSIGQIWVLRKEKDRNKYELPSEIVSELKKLHPYHKKPWYTFFILYLIGIFVVLVLIFKGIQKIEKNIRIDQSLKETITFYLST